MSNALDGFALINAWLVMVGLGMSESTGARGAGGWHQAALLGYLAPWLGLSWVAWYGVEPSLLQGLGLCISAGFGTSGAALHRMAGGNGEQAARLVIGSCLLAILFVPAGIALIGGDAPDTPLLGKVLLLCLLGQALPYGLGRALKHRAPDFSRSIAVPLERLANVAVLGLIGLIALLTLPHLVTQAELLLIASVPIALMLSASLFGGSVKSGNPQLIILTRNLGGAILVARVLPEPDVVLLAIVAFGVPMYGLALLATWLHRRLACCAPGAKA